jgi:hypothetical protein
VAAVHIVSKKKEKKKKDVVEWIYMGAMEGPLSTL